MTVIRRLFLIVGIIAVFVGAIWFGQGTGIFPYPSLSFMVNQGQWAHYGTELALAGLVLIVLSRGGVKKAEPNSEAPASPTDGESAA